MKNYISKKILFAVSLLFLITACKDPLQQKVEKQSDKIVLKISADFANVNMRVASVSAEEEILYYKTLNYTLKAVDSDFNEIILLSDCLYEEVWQAETEIEPGEWTFTLFANDLEKNSTVLAAVCSKTISSEDSFVEFKMKTSEGVTGSIKIKIYYDNNYLETDENGDTVYPNFTLNVLNTKITDDYLDAFESQRFECQSTGDEEENDLYSNTYTAEYPVGKWYVQTWYNEEFEDSELFYISPNLTTTAEFHARKQEQSENSKKTLKFTYNVYGAEPSYCANINLSDISGWSEANLTTGDKYKIKISGYPTKKSYIHLYSFIFNEQWDEMLALQIYDLDLYEDKYFSHEFCYDNYNGAESIMQLSYDSTFLDDELTINDFNIEIKKVEYVDITYCLGGIVYTESVEAETYYSLEDVIHIDGHKLLGWYDNPEFTGKPIIEIPAEENIISKTLYAKYDFIFSSYNPIDPARLMLFFDELNLSNPEPEQNVTVKLKGISPVTMDMCRFVASLTGENKHSEIIFGDNIQIHSLTEDEEFELCFNFFMPKEFNSDIRNFKILLTAGVPTSIDTVWDVSVECKEISESFETKNIIAESQDDGIHITVVNTDDTDWNNISIKELESDITYKHSGILPAGDSFNFVYPYVDENKVYDFAISYQKSFGDPFMYYHFDDNFQIMAIGGLGEIDQTAYNNINLSLSADDSDGMCRYLTFNGFNDDEIKSMAQNAPRPYFKLSVFAGDDILDREWISESSIWIEDDDYFYKKLMEQGKLDVIELVSGNASNLNNRNYYFAELSLIFYGYENGYFEFSQKNTDLTPFVPLGKIITVSFYDDNGLIYQEKILAGNTLSNIFEYNENREHQTFVGWFYEGPYNIPFTFEDEITEDAKIFALWEIDKYTVTFKDGSKVTNKKVEYNTTVEEPSEPEKPNYTFLGWFKEDGTKFSFDQTIMDDLILEAKWQAPNAGFSITFMPIANTTSGTLAVNYETEGDKIILTPSSENTKVAFYAWSVDGLQAEKNDICTITNYDSHTIVCFACAEDGDIVEVLNIKISR